MSISLPLLAVVAVFSAGLGHAALGLFIAVLVGLVVWALGRWIFPMFGMPAIGMRIWDVVFVLIGALAFINFLCGLAGHPLVG